MAKVLAKDIFHVLLVEDDDGDVRLIKEALRENNIKCKLSIAETGLQALDFLYCREQFVAMEKPDLVLLDLNLPIVSGHEVLRIIKDDQVLRLLPVVILTTSASRSDIQKAYETHANSYLQKPLDFEGMITLTRQLFEYWFSLAKLPQ